MKGRGEVVPFAAQDRFLLPLHDRLVLRYFRRCLFVPHRIGERLRTRLRSGGSLRLGTGGEPVGAEEGLGEWRGWLDATRAAFGLLRGTSLEGRRLRWILMRGDGHGAARRAVLFLFEAGQARPAAVLKWCRPASLRREHDALLEGAGRLPPALRVHLPLPLAFGGIGDGDALLLSCLPGRSAYVEMQSALLPGLRVKRHFDAAGAWLAAFHNATRRGEHNFSHGDFWARNLLLEEKTGAPCGVVDWEHASADASPFDDLFHFPLTYGLSYLWSRYRRRDPEEAFRRTFLEDNRVSRAVERYLGRYCAATGLDAGRLRPHFDLYLADHSRRATLSGAIEGGLWPRFHAMLATSGRSVFSG